MTNADREIKKIKKGVTTKMNWSTIKEYGFYLSVFIGVAFIAFSGGYYFGMEGIKIGNNTFFQYTNMMPGDKINESKIQVYENFTCIQGEFEWSKYSNTGSMRPTLGQGHNGLSKDIHNKSDVQVGDIVSFIKYNPFGNDSVIVHRIIEIGNDTKGWYAVTKGDNNAFTDGKVRWNQMIRVLIAIIY